MALDLFMLTYGEPGAEANWRRLVGRFPYARRIDGVEGIANAHRMAASLAATRYLYVVDGDCEVDDAFDFSFEPFTWERAAFVWHARNPVNDLAYGYGGIKLFPRRVLLAQAAGVDFFTSFEQIVVVEDVAGTTVFNTSPFAAWRSGFREAAKLASGCIRTPDPATVERLAAWCTVGADRPFGRECIAGARAGRDYGTEHAGHPETLARINDFAFLRTLFESSR